MTRSAEVIEAALFPSEAQHLLRQACPPLQLLDLHARELGGAMCFGSGSDRRA